MGCLGLWGCSGVLGGWERVIQHDDHDEGCSHGGQSLSPAALS